MSMLYTPSGTTQVGAQSTSSSKKSDPFTFTKSTATTSLKRQRPRADDEDEEDTEDEEHRDPKRQKKDKQIADPEPILKLACPYRKHNPTKYSIDSSFELCALRNWPTMARVK